MSETAPEAAPSEERFEPDFRRDAPAVAAMGGLFLLSIVLAIVFSSTFAAQDIRAFEDPENLLNPVFYLGIVIVFTLVILLIVKYGKQWIIRLIVLGAVMMTIYYVVAPLVGNVAGFWPAVIAGGVAAVGLTILLYRYPEWYVVDVVGVLVAAGAAGIFGISLGILPSLILLVAFATYDAIAVYRTKHMLDLADSVLELRLPIMFVVPKSRGYSFLEETRKIRAEADEPEEEKQPREAMFMGLGDAVIPGVLVVSAFTFLQAGPSVAGLAGPVAVSILTLAGSFAGFLALMYFVMKGRPHAGLPLLNGGAILGFLIGVLPLYGVAPLWPF